MRSLQTIKRRDRCYSPYSPILRQLAQRIFRAGPKKGFPVARIGYRIEARVADDIRQTILDENRRTSDVLDREFMHRGNRMTIGCSHKPKTVDLHLDFELSEDDARTLLTAIMATGVPGSNGPECERELDKMSRTGGVDD